VAPNAQVDSMGEEKKKLTQCEMLEVEVMNLINRAYDEYDLPQEAIWGVLLKGLMRETISHIGSEYFLTEEDLEDEE
jgi:hypothetical protein